MEVVRRVKDLRAAVRNWKAEGHCVGLVPSMGPFHDGHASLVDCARPQSDRIIVAAVPGPVGEGAGAPFGNEPDIDRITGTGCDLIFAPLVAELFPPGFGTHVVVDSLTDVLCGAAKPGYFNGVTLIAAKILNQSQADRLFMGEKEWQLFQVVRHMVRDLDLPTEVIACPTKRAGDGVAFSARNSGLTDEERELAPVMYTALTKAAQDIADGVPTELACFDAQESLLYAGFGSVDYLECRDAQSLRLAPSPGIGARVFVAATLGKTRLIDNVPVPSNHAPA